MQREHIRVERRLERPPLERVTDERVDLAGGVRRRGRRRRPREGDRGGSAGATGRPSTTKSARRFHRSGSAASASERSPRAGRGRTTARSPPRGGGAAGRRGCSVSIRLVRSDSTVSGSSSASTGASASSRMKSGLPAARSVSAASVGVRERQLARRGERELARRLAPSGSSSISAPPSGGPDGRRVVTQRATAAAPAARAARARAATRRRASACPRRRSPSASTACASGTVSRTSCRRSRRNVGSISSTSDVDGDLGAEREREQRQPLREVGHHACTNAISFAPAASGASSGRIPTSGRRSARAARTASTRSTPRSASGAPGTLARARDDLLEEPRLPGAGVADELDGATLTHPCGVERLAQGRELGLAADDRQVGPRVGARRRERADADTRSPAPPCPSSGTGGTSSRSCVRERWSTSRRCENLALRRARGRAARRG